MTNSGKGGMVNKNLLRVIFIGLTLWLANLAVYAQHNQASLFFYDRATGFAAVCHIDQDGFFRQTQGLVNKELPANLTHVVNAENGLLLYNQTDGSAIVGYINRDGLFQQTRSFGPGELRAGWSHIVKVGHDLIFYNTTSGEGQVGAIDRAGNFSFTRSFVLIPESAGFTHVVNTKNGLLFYNWVNGAIVVGQFDRESNFHQTSVLNPYPDAAGLKQIVSTDEGLLFYNPVEPGWMTARINRAGIFEQATRTRDNYSFIPGEILVSLKDGVLNFGGVGYRVPGTNVVFSITSSMIRIDPSGRPDDTWRDSSAKIRFLAGPLDKLERFENSFTGGYRFTQIINNGDYVFSYNANRGVGQVGRIESIYPRNSSANGNIQTYVKTFSASTFWRGWTHIVSTHQ